jgi:hypothetical protein
MSGCKQEYVLDGIMAMLHLPAAAGKEAFARRTSTEVCPIH